MKKKIIITILDLWLSEQDLPKQMVTFIPQLNINSIYILVFDQY